MSRRKIEPEPPKHHQVVAELKSLRSPDYRPKPTYASVEEAKLLLRKRYEKRGFEVKRVNRYDKSWFTVSFEPGKGPSGLESVLCNWPYINDLPTSIEAENFLRRDVLKVLEENAGEGRCRRKK
jgi:hypothetical protein